MGVRVGGDAREVPSGGVSADSAGGSRSEADTCRTMRRLQACALVPLDGPDLHGAGGAGWGGVVGCADEVMDGVSGFNNVNRRKLFL